LGGLTWFAAGLAIGRFGQAFWERLIVRILNMQTSWFESSEDQIKCDESASGLTCLTEEILNLCDPNRKPSGIYLGTVFGVGLPHGMLIGTVFGSLLPLTSDWSVTAFRGALLGLGSGPVFVCLLYAIVLPIFFAVSCRGPSIKGIRALVWSAAEEAERMGHEPVRPIHLLLAVLRVPSGAVEELLIGHTFKYDQIHDHIAAQFLDAELSEDSFEETECFSIVVLKAIEEARGLKNEEVEAGHVLLALLAVSPTVTAETLQIVGLDPTDVRKQVINYLT
jgi:hypothetical protein